MFSLESPHRGDSNKIRNIPFSIYKRKISLNYPKSAAVGFFFKGLKDQFETAVVNEPSVFEPLKFYCILYCQWICSTIKALEHVTISLNIFSFKIFVHSIQSMEFTNIKSLRCLVKVLYKLQLKPKIVISFIWN